MSFYTSLSGLKGAQTDLSVISNNVANVGTVGFKKSRTEFGDLISSAPLQASGSIAGQGTRLKGIDQQFTQGAAESTDRTLDLMISGQGFFVTRGGVTGGQTAFTRNGSFNVNADRYVVNSTGGYLQVLPVDEVGKVTATGIDSSRPLQLPLTTGQPKSTTKLDLSVTLPSSAGLPASNPKFDVDNPYVFDRLDPDTYNQSTATTVYDAQGNALPATIYFTRTSLPDAVTGESSWDARLFVGNQEVDSNRLDGTSGPLELRFDSNGVMIVPDGEVSFGNVDTPLELDIKFGATTRQANAPFTRTSLSQDGFSAGKLDNVSVGSDGLVIATFSNGSTQPLGKLLLANFANPGGLRQLGDARWSVSGESGEAIVGEANSDGFGAIQSGSLERANVDITEELVALISAQRNFSANAKAIETANNMNQTIVNLRT
ncbi:flagellar basal body FlaE [Sphingomonas oleivorans]|uniref:Flagellar hook protein FlgE n=1 Tax=Sphingomonas oleivorans TaxID=1735121 RepID=A0A2T5FUE3_9SPHN|nr:flagellar hook protein FlgE [Sphingomonas oleivorans]PTQ08145.1 flagellar basal body FlaE [Sphingomonas oleivorans]